MDKRLYDHILGSLACSAIGDAMGAGTEILTEDEIVRLFGKRATDFQMPPACHPHSGGREAGQITDDASLTFYLARAYVEAGGEMTLDLAVKTILAWSENSDYYPRFAGPATMEAVMRLRKGDDPIEVGRHGEISLNGVTNGAAMKISPAGLMHPGDLDAAIEDAITICLPTHGTQLAMSGAAAVACAVSEGLRAGSSVFSVIRAAQYGARRGEELGRQRGRIAAGPSVIDRLDLAISLALQERDADEACRKIGRVVGSGLPIGEAVPAALGIFLAMDGDPRRTIEWGANIGDDTDTVACIAGAVAGAWAGIEKTPEELYRQVVKINHLDLEGLAAQMESIVSAR